jgi:hypothetical protein
MLDFVLVCAGACSSCRSRGRLTRAWATGLALVLVGDGELRLGFSCSSIFLSVPSFVNSLMCADFHRLARAGHNMFHVATTCASLSIIYATVRAESRPLDVTPRFQYISSSRPVDSTRIPDHMHVHPIRYTSPVSFFSCVRKFSLRASVGHHFPLRSTYIAGFDPAGIYHHCG